MLPTNRSAHWFCHGDLGDISTCSIPLELRNGALSHGKLPTEGEILRDEGSSPGQEGSS